MWHLYIIRCADNSLYTGITTDVERRLNEHNSGKGGNYTRTRIPVSLVHVESYDSKSKALKRECQIKRLTKGQKEMFIKNQSVTGE